MMQLWTLSFSLLLTGHVALGADTTLQTISRSSCFAPISQISDGQPQAPITCLPPSVSSSTGHSSSITSSNGVGQTSQPGSSQTGAISTSSPLFSVTRTMDTSSRLGITQSGGPGTTSLAGGTSSSPGPGTSQAASSTSQAGSSRSSGSPVPGSSRGVTSQSSVSGAPSPSSSQNSISSSVNSQGTPTASTNSKGPSFLPTNPKGASSLPSSTGETSVSSGSGMQSGSTGPMISLSMTSASSSSGLSSSGPVSSGSKSASSGAASPVSTSSSLSSWGSASSSLPKSGVSSGPITSGPQLSTGSSTVFTSSPTLSISSVSSEDNDVWYDDWELWGQKKTPTVGCQAPCTINFPPYTLKAVTTIIWPIYTTSLMSVHGGTTTQSMLPVWELVDGEPTRTKKACALVANATTETITTTCVVDPIVQKTVDFYPINVEKTDTVDTSFTAEPIWIPPPCTAVLPKGMATFPPTPYPGQDKAISSFKWNWGPGGPTCFATADSTVPFQPQPTLEVEPPKDDHGFPIWICFQKSGGKGGGGGGKKKKKPCQFFGCGCGPFGLPFGPGCGGGLSDIDDFAVPFEWPTFPGIDPPDAPDLPHITTIPREPEYPCGMYGCNMACGPKGCGGSRGPGGYKPACPPEKCYPKECQQDPDKCRKGCKKEDQTIVTDQLVSCPQVNPSSSSCTTEPTKTRTVCKGQAVTQTTSDACKKTTVTDEFISCTQFGSTTSSCNMTRTATRSGCSIEATTSPTIQGPACTRSALSLDDDEGDNEGELGRPSGTNSRASTNVASTAKPSFSKVSSSQSSKVTSTATVSPTSDTPKSSSSPPAPPPSPSIPAPSILPLPPNNHWEIHFHQQIHGQDSSLSWTIYDSNNNNEAGKGNNGPIYPNRDIHLFPHKLDVTVRDERDQDKTIVALFWRTEIWQLDRKDWHPCFPTFDTGNKKQGPRSFCMEDRGRRFGMDPYGCDISQKDLKWYKTSEGGVARDFKCGFTAFWGGRPLDVYATL